jgi:uncharacterized protein with NRDE domain
MCLILVAWCSCPGHPLVVAANRDEFHARPSAPFASWQAPGLFAGRDLQAGGTWLGLDRRGRFAAVTNVREGKAEAAPYSRGQLPVDFLTGTATPLDFCTHLDGAAYGGFNLLAGDLATLAYCSNRGDDAQLLAPGIYGLSNHRLDTPWPKLTAARTAFAAATRQAPDFAALFALLADRSRPSDEELPSTGVPFAWERLLSSIFIADGMYGTRASTVLAVAADGSFRGEEHSFGPYGVPSGSVHFSG